MASCGTSGQLRRVEATTGRIISPSPADTNTCRNHRIAASEKPWSCVIDDEPSLGGQALKIRFNAKTSGLRVSPEHEDVSMNIAMIMYGIDPQTKKFTERPEQIKEEIAALCDGSVPRPPAKHDATHAPAEGMGALPPAGRLL
jgi:hypothetical protein